MRPFKPPAEIIRAGAIWSAADTIRIRYDLADTIRIRYDIHVHDFKISKSIILDFNNKVNV